MTTPKAAAPMPYPADADMASGSKAFRDSTVVADANFSNLAVSFNDALASCARLTRLSTNVFTPAAGITVNFANAWQFGGSPTSSGYITYLGLMLTVPGSLAFNAVLGTYSSSLPGVSEVVSAWVGFRATGGTSYSMCGVMVGSVTDNRNVYWGGLLNAVTPNPAGSFAIGITFQSGRLTVMP